jgi:hypothetical protein
MSFSIIPVPGGSKNNTFSIVSVPGSETGQFPRLAAQNHYVLHSSIAWRLRNNTFSIVPAPGGSIYIVFFKISC